LEMWNEEQRASEEKMYEVGERKQTAIIHSGR